MFITFPSDFKGNEIRIGVNFLLIIKENEDEDRAQMNEEISTFNGSNSAIICTSFLIRKLLDCQEIGMPQ